MIKKLSNVELGSFFMQSKCATYVLLMLRMYVCLL